mgnify:FL=1
MVMDHKVAVVAIILVSSTLAGCTGDPDAGGNDEIDLGMFQDFLNNSTIEVISNMTANSDSTTYYQHGQFGYFGDDYEYDLGVWTEVEHNTWTYVGTPANWIDVMTISQASGEKIDLIYATFTGMANETQGVFSNQSMYDVFVFSDFSAGNWELDCVNGVSTELRNDQWNSGSLHATPYIMYSGYTDPHPTFPFPGVECEFTLNFLSWTEFSTVWWSIAYTVTEISEGPHN